MQQAIDKHKQDIEKLRSDLKDANLQIEELKAKLSLSEQASGSTSD
jgi:predicted RNase H-like nuclease (RuvC/YqgF family)